MEDKYFWLTSFLNARVNSASAISDVVPPIFDHYFIIEWNYGIIEDFPFDGYPKDDSNIEDLNKQHEIKRRFGLFLSNDTEHLYKPISIKQLAERFNVPYSINTINDIPYTPGISSLRAKTELGISSLVSSVTSAEELNLYVADNYRFSYEAPMNAQNLIKSSEEYLHFQKETGRDSCSYLFPGNHEWCLITIEDVPYFIFATSSGIAQKIQSITNLEYFEVTEDFTILNP